MAKCFTSYVSIVWSKKPNAFWANKHTSYDVTVTKQSLIYFSIIYNDALLIQRISFTLNWKE